MLSKYKLALALFFFAMTLILIVPGAQAESSYRPSGNIGLFVAYVSWPGAPNPAVKDRKAQQKLVNDWYRQASRQRVAINPSTFIHLPLKTALSNCTSTPEWWMSWARQVSQAARDQGYNIPQNYKLLSIVVPGSSETSCLKSAGAFGLQDGTCRPVDDGICGLSMYRSISAASPTIIHETLHNLGLRHANFAECPGGRFSYTKTCRSMEYGDRYDPMGGGVGYSQRGLLNPIYAEQLGWNPETATPVSARQQSTVRLRPYSGSQGVRVAKVSIPAAAELGGVSPGQLYISYRPNSGADSRLYQSDLCPSNQRLAGGLLIHLRLDSGAVGKQLLSNFFDSGERLPSYLIDADPTWGQGYCGVSLRPGRSWSTPDNGLRLEFKALKGSQAEIVVTRPSQR